MWGLGKLLALVCALTGTFLLFALIGMRVALRAREVQVPTVVGLTTDAASQALLAHGLSLRIDPNQRADDRVPAGRIVQQEPAGGSQARQQRTIRAWVSSGPRTITVPALVGHTERTARMRAAVVGLHIATT
jgi:serine/threonine-protein kinase